MRLIPILFGAAALSLPVLAAADPIATRQALMDSLAASAGLAGGVQKGEIEYAPAIGKAALTAAAATALAYGDYFPEGSDSGETKASPKIWSDRAAFDAELAKFREAAMTAAAGAGKDGPADAAAFVELFKPVMGTCKSCHEGFRLK